MSAITTALLLASLGAAPAGEAATVSVTPKQTDAALLNPGMGLYMSGSTRTRLKEGDWFRGVVDIMYIRTQWATIEPEEDKPLEDYFGPIFNYWVKEQGKRVAFRVMSESVSSRERYVTPKWVFDKGVPGVQHRGRGGVQTDPIFWDERYLEECEKLIAKLGACLDGREGLEFIDICQIGEWGEMHLGLHIPGRWTPQQLAETGFTETKYIQAYRRIIDAYARAFPRSQVFLNVGPYVSVDDYAAIRGLHFRQDGLTAAGASYHVGKWLYAPYADRGVKGNFEFRSSYAGLESMKGGFKGAVEKGLEAPISYLNTNCFWMPRLRTAPPAARAILRDAARRIGYRFVLTRATIPKSIRVDGAIPARLPIAHEWRNMGVAPCTESFAIEFTLANARGEVVARAMQFPSTPTTRWAPGKSVEEHVVLDLPATIAPGQYALKVAMVWPEKGRRILLGIEGRDGDDRYAVASIPCVKVAPRRRVAYAAGFEAGDTLWAPATGMRVERDTTVKHSGNASMRVHGRQQGSWNYVATSIREPLIPAARYRLSCWLRVGALKPGRRPPYVKVGLHKANHDHIENVNTNRYDMGKAGEWQRLSATFDAPPSAVEGRLAVEKGGKALDMEADFWVDDVRLELLAAP